MNIAVVAKEKPGLKPIGVKIPQKTADEWTAWCTDAGLYKWKAFVAAFRLLRLAPPKLRELAISGGHRQLKRWFSDAEKALMKYEWEGGLDEARRDSSADAEPKP